MSTVNTKRVLYHNEIRELKSEHEHKLNLVLGWSLVDWVVQVDAFNVLSNLNLRHLISLMRMILFIAGLYAINVTANFR